MYLRVSDHIPLPLPLPSRNRYVRGVVTTLFASVASVSYSFRAHIPTGGGYIGLDQHLLIQLEKMGSC